MPCVQTLNLPDIDPRIDRRSDVHLQIGAQDDMLARKNVDLHLTASCAEEKVSIKRACVGLPDVILPEILGLHSYTRFSSFIK